MSYMHATIEQARAEVRRLKRTTPGIFPEYNNLQHAEAQLKLAQERVRIAREAWRKLGSPRKC